MPNNPEEELQADTRWYAKAAPIIEKVIEVSQRLCAYPSQAVSIDEMMKRFKGRSSQTYRMKAKPIKQGYKFFSICDASTGYVWHMIPDGYQEKTTIKDIVLELASSLPRRETLRYVVGMDNYFTYSAVISGLRALGVATIGTARAKRGWPPREMYNITDSRFNTLYLMKDKDNYLIGRWVDNNVVTMVSTCHTGYETIKRHRRRPRPTATNRNHIREVWGTQGKAEVEIPCMIDDYNHWMGGVDKADQMIAYYRPDLRCRRTWMPLMFHALDVMRVNAYIIASKFNTGLEHKEFVCLWVKALLDRATSFSVQRERTSKRRASPTNQDSSSSNKRYRTSHVRPCLPAYRLEGHPSEHKWITDESLNGKAKFCRYCSFASALAKVNGLPATKIKTTIKICLRCGDALCKEHKDVFHQPDYVEEDTMVNPVRL